MVEFEIHRLLKEYLNIRPKYLCDLFNQEMI